MPPSTIATAGIPNPAIFRGKSVGMMGVRVETPVGAGRRMKLPPPAAAAAAVLGLALHSQGATAAAPGDAHRA